MLLKCTTRFQIRKAIARKNEDKNETLRTLNTVVHQLDMLKQAGRTVDDYAVEIKEKGEAIEELKNRKERKIEERQSAAAEERRAKAEWDQCQMDLDNASVNCQLADRFVVQILIRTCASTFIYPNHFFRLTEAANAFDGKKEEQKLLQKQFAKEEKIINGLRTKHNVYIISKRLFSFINVLNTYIVKATEISFIPQ